MNSCTETEGWLRGKQNQLETLRKKKLERIAIYNLNPINCKQCQKNLSYQEAQKGKTFCNQSCSASYNNIRKPRRAQKKLVQFVVKNFKKKLIFSALFNALQLM
jgi:hypothetical protein